MITNNSTNYVPSVLAGELTGLESLRSFISSNSSDHNAVVKKAFGTYGADTNIKLQSLLKKYIPQVNQSEWLNREEKIKMFHTDISKGIEAVAKEYAYSVDKFNTLPSEIQATLKHLKQQKIALENAKAEVSNGTPTQKKAADHRLSQVNIALENALFTIFSGVKEAQIGKYRPTESGMESYSYQAAIVYPKLETQVQWIAACATMYNKVLKIKQLYNKFTSIPVHTQIPMYQVVDPDDHTIKHEFRREDVLAYIDPRTQDKAGSELEGVSKLFKTLTKKVSINKSNFRQLIKLRSDLLFTDNNGVLESQPSAAAGQLSAITADELARSDFYVDSLTINGVKSDRIYDVRAGLMLSETNNEQDYKGKVLLVTPDPSKKTETYYLTLEFNGQDQTIMVAADKAHGSTAANDVDSIEITFKILDPFNMWKSTPDYILKEERGYLNAGPEIKEWLPIIQDQLEILDERMGGSYFARIMNMATEFIGQRKEIVFFEGYKAMSDKVRADFYGASELVKKKTLYAAQTVDLQIATSVNKIETMNVQLGPAFHAIAQKYRIASQSQSDAQINMFASSYHLGVFAGKMTVVTGEVSEAADDKFLGVNQEATVNILTIGDDIKSPVSAIVVGTDKGGLEAKTVDASNNPLSPDQIKYSFYMMPWFAEANIQTIIGTETPIRVTNDPAQRNPKHPNVPSLCMDTTFNMNTLRGATGDFIIYGYNTQLLP